MAARGFDPGPRRMTGSFFPLRTTRRRDMRVATLRLEEEGIVQERAAAITHMRGRNMLNSGDVRQTTPPPWSARARPTHFIAMRLPAQCTLRTSIEALQGDVADSFTLSHWHAAFVPPARLHLTLAVMTVPSASSSDAAAPLPGDAIAAHRSAFDERQLRAVEAISREHFAAWRQATRGRGFVLRANTIGFFDDHRVAFARLANDHDYVPLNEAVRALRRHLAEAGVDVKGNPHDDFIPHVTIAKVSQKLARERFGGQRRLPTALFAHAQWDDLGAAAFREVGLCTMKPLSRGAAPVVPELDTPTAERAAASGDESGAPDAGASDAPAASDTAGAKPIDTSAKPRYYDELLSFSLQARHA
jgi:2'-5' RNA ligase